MARLSFAHADTMSELTASTDEFSFRHPSNAGVCNASDTRLVLLGESDDNTQIVKALFTSGWLHPHKPPPQIRAVYKVLYPDDKIQSYLAYRTRVDASMRKRARSPREPGNQRLLFHGTTRSCRLVENPKTLKLCRMKTCSLCQIVRNSFDVKKSGSKFAFRRFGSGIYTSTCSSKADDYTTNYSWKGSFRILIVNRVVVGNTMVLTTNNQQLDRPVSGFHSVTGKPGNNLKYEETVVYNNDAIRPAYLIVYGEEFKMMDALSSIFRAPLAF